MYIIKVHKHKRNILYYDKNTFMIYIICYVFELKYNIIDAIINKQVQNAL